MKKNGFTSIEFMVLLLIIFVLTILVGSFFSIGLKTDIVTYKVTEKVRTGGETSKYLIFSEGETFENTDSWLDWKFNSSDFYGKIKIGETYTSKVRGVRIPFLSMYRNIVTLNYNNCETTSK